MITRLVPPICTMLRPATTSSTFCVEPRPARAAPMTRAMTAAMTTIAFLPPTYAVEGSCWMRRLLGNARAAASTTKRAGMRNARKLPSIAMVGKAPSLTVKTLSQ